MHRTEARMYLARLAELYAESRRTKSLLRRLRLYSEADRVVWELVVRHPRELRRLQVRRRVALRTGSTG